MKPSSSPKGQSVWKLHTWLWSMQTPEFSQWKDSPQAASSPRNWWSATQQPHNEIRRSFLSRPFWFHVECQIGLDFPTHLPFDCCADRWTFTRWTHPIHSLWTPESPGPRCLHLSSNRKCSAGSPGRARPLDQSHSAEPPSQPYVNQSCRHLLWGQVKEFTTSYFYHFVIIFYVLYSLETFKDSALKINPCGQKYEKQHTSQKYINVFMFHVHNKCY